MKMTASRMFVLSGFLMLMLGGCAADPSGLPDETSADDGADGFAEDVLPGEDPNLRDHDKAVNRTYVEWCRDPRFGRALCRPYDNYMIDQDIDECRRDVRRVCGNVGSFHLCDRNGCYYLYL